MLFTTTLLTNFFKNDVIGTAAQTAFYLILSIPTVLILALSITANLSFLASDTIVFEYVFPANVAAIFDSLSNFLPQSSSITAISAVGVIFSASGSIWALMKGIHKAHTQEKLNFKLKYRLLALVFTTAFVIAILVSLSILVVGGILPALTEMLSLIDIPGLSIWPRILSALTIYLFVHLLYRFTPGVDLKGTELFWGSLFSAISWAIVSLLFEFYINYFTRYTTIYGGIGAFFVLIMWLFVISMIILTGAHINATLIQINQMDI